MISVITPVYNGGVHIENCLKTVIDQHCDNLEHIIVDGSSKDSTVSILKQYASTYSHIKWISEPDKGQSDAMNKGIAMANGEVLAILNVDDYYEPEVLNRVISLFKNLSEPALLVGNCNVWDDQGNLKYINKPSKLDITELLLGWKINPHPVNPSAYFYHKSLHEIIGLYDINNHFAMDLDFLFSAAVAANIKYVDETFGNYRFLEGTKTVLDSQRGDLELRAKKIRQKHIRKLSNTKKIQFFITKFAHQYLPVLYKIRHRIRRKIGI
jgi:glycosyltransferase involved in cell wall biosynthesis